MIVVVLILLGVGWNFSYTGGSAFLTMNVKGTYALEWRGVNDTVISIFAALGAFFIHYLGVYWLEYYEYCWDSHYYIFWF